MDTRHDSGDKDARSRKRRAAIAVEALEGRTLMAAGGSITDIASLPAGVTAGPMAVDADGYLWFAETGNAAGPTLGKLSATGLRTDLPLPAGDAGFTLASVATDSAGDVWYALDGTGGAAGKIGKVAPGGGVTEYTLPVAGATPGAITIGADGHPYVAVAAGSVSAIVRVNPDGSFSASPVNGAQGAVTWLTAGSGGDLWFVDGTKVGKMTPAGVVTEYPVIAPAGSGVTVDLSNAQLAAGRDGNMWFLGAGGISKITPTGTVTTIGSAGSQVTSLAAGPDGNLWIGLVPPAGSQLALAPGEVIVRLTPDGQITPLSDHVDTGGSVVRMAQGPNSLWLNEGGTALSMVNVSSVSTITPAQITPTTPTPVTTDARKTVAGPLVSFTANYPGALATDFTATINYGDGYTGNGAVVSDGTGDGGFDVLGYDTYKLPAGTSVKVTVDVTGPAGVVTEIYGVVTIASPPAAKGKAKVAAHATKAPAPVKKVAHPKGPAASAVKQKT